VIFLPIVDRELRVASRQRSTFWTRLIAAIVALVIASGFLILSYIQSFMFGPPALGKGLFAVLTWLSLGVALSAGLFFTADCLSEEKREGTLGFLFLTDLRGYDVVLGKLLATSLRGAFALISVFPILGVTLLMGGVTGAQFWQTTLALVSTSVSSAASCARAPSGVCGNPEGIPTAPVLVDAGSTIAPGSRTDKLDGCAARRSALPIGAAASESRRACTASVPPAAEPAEPTEPPGPLEPFWPLEPEAPEAAVVTDPSDAVLPTVSAEPGGWNRSHTHSTTPPARLKPISSSSMSAATSRPRPHSPGAAWAVDDCRVRVSIRTRPRR